MLAIFSIFPSNFWPFWIHFGVPRREKVKIVIMKIVLPPKREHDFQGSDPPKIDLESRKTPFAAKIDENALPGTAFLGKSRFLVIFGLPRGTQKCVKRVYHHWGRPLMGAILCHFGHLNALFSLLDPFWVHSGLLRGHFLTNLHRFLTMFLMSPFHLCLFFFEYFLVFVVGPVD